MVSEAQRQAFYRLVWPHADVVIRTARILLKEPAAAEDLAQETFLKAIRFIDQFKEGTDARAWLLSILRNTRIDVLRKTNRDPRLRIQDLDEEPAADDVEPLHDTGGRSAEELLEQFGDDEIIAAVGALPEEIRWTLLLVDVEGIAQDEAAKILNVPVGTVKSRAHRGRNMLRQLLMPLAIDRRLAHPAVEVKARNS